MAPMQAAMATPRLIESQRSTRAPPAMESGAAPKTPQKKRPIKTVWMFRPKVTGRQKSVNMDIPTNMGHLRPNLSDMGPHIGGPTAYPCTLCQQHLPHRRGM